MQSGKIGAPEDILTIQFSNGEEAHTVVLENAQELKEWLANHRNIKVLYAFNALCDVASIAVWLESKKAVSYRYRGNQLIARISYGSTDFKVYDSQPLLTSFGLRKLEDCGRLVGIPKQPKPEYIGLRAWQNEEEHEAFIKYAAQDAIITSKIVQYIKEKIGADPVLHASAGTVARDKIRLPKRLKRGHNPLSPLEHKVKANTFAGRNEGFVTGFTSNVTYNDVTSLYPCSIVCTRCLEITGAEPCGFDDITLSDDLENLDFGWIDGIFRVPHSKWDGLPLRGRNNFYAIGDRISGFYNTMDLAASHAEVIAVAECYRPIYRTYPSHMHDIYADMLMQRLEGNRKKEEKLAFKGVLNSLSGKLGQSHPITSTSNFFAYNTLLAHSHLIMSRLFDKCPSEVLAMDTDSIFSETDLTGKYFELSDGERTFPVKMDSKGKGDLCFFRSKNYILKPEKGDLVFGRHGWVYFVEDFFKLFDGTLTEILTRQEVKHTLLTHVKAAQQMEFGRWFYKPVTLDLEKLKALLSADTKRNRTNYDSYGLVMQRKNTRSEAWNYEEIMSMEADLLGYPVLPIRA
jgi:hypothetical protein